MSESKLVTLSFIPTHTYEDKYSQMKEYVLKTLHENSKARFNLTFTQPTEVRVNNRTIKEVVELKDVGFFEVDNTLCYTKSKGFRVHGYPVKPQYLNVENLESISIMEVNETLDKKRRAKSLAKQIPEGGLSHVKNQLLTSPLESFPSSNFRPIYYAVRFPKREREELRQKLAEAFENRSDFQWSYYAESGRGNARDLSIKLSVDENGEYGGYMTSYYPGTGNGDEFIVLNEKVAFFVETD